MRETCRPYKEYVNYSYIGEYLAIYSVLLKKSRNEFFLANQNKISGPTLKNIFAVIFVVGLRAVWKDMQYKRSYKS